MTVYNKLCLAAIIAALFAGSPCHSQEVSFGSLKLDYEGRLVMALQPLKDLDELYAGNLEKRRAEAVQSGNLQQVLAAKAEIEGFREGSAPEIPETFPELRRYQSIYRAERAKRLAAVAETMKPLHAAYHRQLVELQTQLTRQEKLDEAVEVGKAIAEIEERIASGEVPGLNLVAAAGVPATLASPASIPSPAQTGPELTGKRLTRAQQKEIKERFLETLWTYAPNNDDWYFFHDDGACTRKIVSGSLHTTGTWQMENDGTVVIKGVGGNLKWVWFHSSDAGQFAADSKDAPRKDFVRLPGEPPLERAERD